MLTISTQQEAKSTVSIQVYNKMQAISHDMSIENVKRFINF
jgi:hypothetical protein